MCIVPRVFLTLQFVFLICVVSVLCSIFWPGGSRRERTEQLERGDLVNIYGMLCQHARCNSGRFPDSFTDLATEGILTNPEVLVSPFGSGESSTGSTTREVIAQIQDPRHVTYLYYGRGITTSSPPDSVLVTDLPDNHKDYGGGGCVLYRDGRVVKFDDANFKKLLTSLPSGMRR